MNIFPQLFRMAAFCMTVNSLHSPLDHGHFWALTFHKVM